MKTIISLILIIFAGGLIMMGLEEGTSASATLEHAVFAGGCFWCMEPPFKKLEGVKEVVSGYTGGSKKNPTYEEVSSGRTGHLEAIEVTFDPSVISYEKLLDVFWKNIDPTDRVGQFVDKGSQYTTAIFYNSPKQKKLAEASKVKLEKSGIFDRPIVTEIRPASAFYRAEEYHQSYFMKNPSGYKAYRAGSGRDRFIEKTWAKRRVPVLRVRRPRSTPSRPKMNSARNLRRFSIR